MPGPRIGAEKESAVLREYDRNGSIRRAALSAGVGFNAAKRVILARGGNPAPSAPDDAPEVRVSREEGEKDGRVEYDSPVQVRTLAEAVAFAGVDLSVWRVRKWECTGWQVGMKVREFAGKSVTAEAPVTRQLWRVKLFLDRLLPRAEGEALDALFARLEARAPAAPKLARIEPPADPHLMILDLVDTHFGKLAWAPESGQNYDLRIADRVYRNAVEDLLSRAACYDVDEFLLPLGSDFLHVDNANGSTTAGTPQDVDGRLAKILSVAEEAVVWAVEELAGRGRVRVAWVPGNHDRTLSYCLARTVKAWFRQHPRVSVDVGPGSRKYHRYGRTLIGLTHGNEERAAVLPGLMATERPDDWAATGCREWHVGHMHKSKKLDFLSLDTHNGVPVRTLRSLSAVDSWHHRKGYVGTSRSAEAYLYSHAGGYAGHFVADVRDEQRRGAA